MTEMDVDHLEAVALVQQQRTERDLAEITQAKIDIAARRAAVVAGQEMAASIARNKQARIVAHGTARDAARAARGRRDILRKTRQQAERKVGASRADLVEAQKQLQKCLPPNLDDFPTDAELDAHRQRFGELDKHCRWISARIGVEADELRTAQVAEDDAQAVLERCAAEEMRLRP